MSTDPSSTDPAPTDPASTDPTAGPGGPAPRGRSTRVLRLGGCSWRVRPRSVVVGALALLVILGAAAASLTGGADPLGLDEVAAALVGRGSRSAEFVLLDLRLPRLLLGLGVGVGLGLGGALLQSLARNPLGSPDLLGVTAGASTGALLAILLGGASVVVVSASALVAGLLVAVVTVLLAGRSATGVGGLRLVLVGLGLQALLLAVNSYLVARAQLADALDALAWLVGDLGSRGWPEVVALYALLVVLVPAALALGRRAALLELSDRVAAGLGVPVGGTRVALLGVAVALAATATAAAGPVAFVALAAPQLARRITRAPTPVPVVSALVGAALVGLGDLVAQRALPDPLPVGIVTGVLGGVYLLGLLVLRTRGAAS